MSFKLKRLKFHVPSSLNWGHDAVNCHVPATGVPATRGGTLNGDTPRDWLPEGLVKKIWKKARGGVVGLKSTPEISSDAEIVNVTFCPEPEVSITVGEKLRPVRVGGVESAGVEVSVRTGLMPMAVN